MTRLVLLDQAMRLTDNMLLQQQGDCMAVLLLDKRQYLGQQHGIVRASPRKLAHSLWLAEDFRLQLQQLQLPLLCMLADANTALPALIKDFGISSVVMAEPVAAEEQQLLQLAALSVPVSCLDLNSLLAAELRPDLNTLPDSFSKFRSQREPELKVSPALSAVSVSGRWLSPDDIQAATTTSVTVDFAAQWQQTLADHPLPQHLTLATERQQQQQFLAYLYDNEAIYHYKTSRNQFCDLPSDKAAKDTTPLYASFVSTALSHGTLSVRWLWQQICVLETTQAGNESTYWLKFELLWREYFRWQQRKFGVLLFSHAGLGRHPVPQPQGDAAQQQLKFSLWCQGQTGLPLVDANMRQLQATGLMSNRGRQLVASYLIYDLGLDWRWGAAYFEQQLLDYDVASNWGNWAYIAGAGTATGRYFNQLKQALQYDSDAYFIRQQVKELSGLGLAAHLPYLSAAAAPWQQQLQLPPTKPDWQSSLAKLRQLLQHR